MKKTPPKEKKEATSLFAEPELDDLSSHAHRQLIGFVGLLLPFLVWFVVSAWRPVDITEHPRWMPLSSISAYYYTGAISVFSGGLIALAVFLFSYQGYGNPRGHRDRVAAIIAGCAAMLVAFYPTDPPKGITAPTWWTDPMKWIHYGAAIVLFLSFFFFCWFQFPITKEKSRPPKDKSRRNLIYRICGVGIFGALLWAAWELLLGGNADVDAPIFWPETLALEFFAISWLVKGRVDKTAFEVGKRTLHYGRHPQQIVSDTWSTLSGSEVKKGKRSKSAPQKK
jgi:hypothetical protein